MVCSGVGTCITLLFSDICGGGVAVLHCYTVACPDVGRRITLLFSSMCCWL